MARVLKATARTLLRSALFGAAIGAIREFVLRRNEQRLGNEHTPYGSPREQG